jgi:hypothetical protein
MRRAMSVILAGLVFVALGSATPAIQTSQEDSPRVQLGESKPTIALNLDDEHVIKEFILSTKNLPRVTENMQLAIRAQIPASIALLQFPEVVTAKVPQLKAHQYFVHENRVIVVDATRRIAEIVD